MIKWDKPIQAMDGRHARVIAHLPDPPGDPNDLGFFTPTMVWVQSATNGFGDVFLVNNRGVRCDDTAKSARCLLTDISQPFIRNAPMKREGWGRVIKSGAGMPMQQSDVIFSTKESAEAACEKLGGYPAFMVWYE
jgi:hypothetical protein